MTEGMNTQDMTAAELKALAASLANQAEIKAADERNAERDRARKAEAEKAKTHYNDLFTDVGQPLAGLNAKQHATVYAMAWEHGHSASLSEVSMYYVDFAEMARKIIEDS